MYIHMVMEIFAQLLMEKCDWLVMKISLRSVMEKCDWQVVKMSDWLSCVLWRLAGWLAALGTCRTMCQDHMGLVTAVNTTLSSQNH